MSRLVQRTAVNHKVRGSKPRVVGIKIVVVFVQMRNVLFVTVFDRYLTVLRLCIGHIFFQIAGHTNGFRLCIGQFDMIDD
jgi:hypothetical protein